MTRSNNKRDKKPYSGQAIIKWLGLLAFENAIAIPVLAAITILAQEAAIKFIGLTTPLWAYPSHHPFRMLFGALIFSASTTAFIRLVRKYKNLSYQNQYNQELLSRYGIESYWDGQNEADQMEAWSYCRNAIGSTPSHLRIMGASGWETFGEINSPMHDTVKNFPGSLQILLIHPESLHLEERTDSLGVNLHDYKEDIYNSIEFLKNLKRKGNRDIELRLYKQPPIWKMVISGNFLWLQHYKQGQHVRVMPVYGFASNAPTSLFHPFLEIFLKRWQRDGEQTESVDIKNWKRP